MASPPPFAAVPQRTASHRMDVGASRKGVFRLTLLMYGMRNRCRWGVTTSRPGVDAPFLLGLALLRHYGGHRDEAAEERHARADDPLQPGRPGRGLGSRHAARLQGHRAFRGLAVERELGHQCREAGRGRHAEQRVLGEDEPGVRRPRSRSEEHTSELQSRQYLVCRLLLEKKTNITA